MRDNTGFCKHVAAVISQRDEPSVGRRGILHLRISALPQYPPTRTTTPGGGRFSVPRLNAFPARRPMPKCSYAHHD